MGKKQKRQILTPQIPELSDDEIKEVLKKEVLDVLEKEYNITDPSVEELENFLNEQIKKEGLVIIPQKNDRGGYDEPVYGYLYPNPAIDSGLASLHDNEINEEVDTTAEETERDNGQGGETGEMNWTFVAGIGIGGLLLIVGFLWFFLFRGGGGSNKGTVAETQPTPSSAEVDYKLGENLPTVGAPSAVKLPDGSLLAVTSTEKPIAGSYGWCGDNDTLCWLKPSFVNTVMGVPHDLWDKHFANLATGDEVFVRMGTYDAPYVIEKIGEVSSDDISILRQDGTKLTLVETFGTAYNKNADNKKSQDGTVIDTNKHRYIVANLELDKAIAEVDTTYKQKFMEIKLHKDGEVIGVGALGKISMQRYLASEDGSMWKSIFYLYSAAGEDIINQMDVQLQIDSTSFVPNEVTYGKGPTGQPAIIITFWHNAPSRTQRFVLRFSEQEGHNDLWPNWDGVEILLPTTPPDPYAGLDILGVSAQYDRINTTLKFVIRYHLSPEADAIPISPTLTSTVTNETITPSYISTNGYFMPADQTSDDGEMKLTVSFMIVIPQDQIVSGHIPELKFQIAGHIYSITRIAAPPTPTPNPNQPTPTPTPSVVPYTIQSGDTAWNIAVQHGISLDMLRSLNPNVDLSHLEPGQIINVPSN